jgi:hypothetical protein
VEWPDAVHVLDRVAIGERFACKEYAIVLSQALNAHGIPARSVALLRRNHHAGLGRAHVVTEAWIDDLGTWVVLDGQNGMYWVDDAARPLGLPELRRRLHAGQPRPDVVSLADKSSADADTWWPYFHAVNPTGVMISPAPYAPMLEATIVQPFEQLRGDPAGTHPDLLELAIGIADVDGRPAIQPVTRHPHAVGFQLSLGTEQWRLPLTGQPWSILTDTAGEHTVTIATLTGYGPHGLHVLRYASR